MPSPPLPTARRPVRVVVATTSLLSFTPVWRAAVLVLGELGLAAFIALSIAEPRLGPAAPWFILGAVVVSLAVRMVDLEASALLVTGGLYGAVGTAFGRPAAAAAAAAVFVGSLAIGALAAMVGGRYLASGIRAISGSSEAVRTLLTDEFSTAISIGLLALVWWWQRQGRRPSSRTLARGVTAVVGVLAVLVIWALFTAVSYGSPLPPLPSPSILTLLEGVGYCLFVVGGGEVLARVVPELPPPKIRNLGRTAALVSAYGLLVTAALGILGATVASPFLRATWLDTPAVALALALRAPLWIRLPLAVGLALAAATLALMAAYRAGIGAQTILVRLAEDGALPESLRALHNRFGTPWRVINLGALAQIGLVLLSAGAISRVASLYAVIVGWAALLRIAALIRLRTARPGGRPFRVPLNPTFAGREWPLGLALIGILLTSCMTALFVGGEPVWLGGTLLLAAVAASLFASERASAGRSGLRHDFLEEFQFSTAVDADSRTLNARAGSVLVPVRKPHVLTHLAAALDSAGPRDVVAMTVRLIGLDVSDDLSRDQRVTDDERQLLSAVVALAERRGRAVRLMIVPSVNVFDAIIQTAIRLHSSEIFTGESETLSADDQARLLGEAWERSPKSDAADVRLVIHHGSGRTDAYHLGAHAPALGADDLRLIHTLWLDLVKTVGPHVHHRDVVRAALTHMDQQLNGPAREQTLDVVREVARPADELSAVVRARDFTRLRDMVRNRPPGDLAQIMTDLSLEDQVVVFRMLPRKVAAATFEYLSHEDQEALLRTMAQDDVAAHPERHVAGRPDHVPRGTAGPGDAAAACAAPARRARSRPDAARLSGRVDRPFDDPRLHRGAGAPDGAGGARLHPRARAGQRNLERDLRGRRHGVLVDDSAFASCCWPRRQRGWPT